MIPHVKIYMEYKGNKFSFEAKSKEQLLKQYKEMMPPMIECILELITLDEQREVLINKLNDKSKEASEEEVAQNT